jgi:glycosyltransferase involved in cell wall biosynthesis
MKIARIATVPFFLYSHLRLQVVELIKAGHDVVIVSSGGPEVELLKLIAGVRFFQINIRRQISPLKDLVSLWELFWFFRKERFDVVHTTTPKAGMLGAIAAFLARVPVRLHTFTGQAWAETRGPLRELAKLGDRLTITLNTRCYADSRSQREFMVNEGVARYQEIHVLGAGSLAGVDLHRFTKTALLGAGRQALDELQVPKEHLIISFIGRITKDKGIKELIESFRELQQKNVACSLLLIGPEEEDASKVYHETNINSLANVHRLGYQQCPEKWLTVTDVFCLPSYREGFGNVIIEAAAMGVPAVGTNIPGLRDAVIHMETGILVPVKDVVALTKALNQLLLNQDVRSVMGKNASIRAREHFDATQINSLLLKDYSFFQRGISRSWY